ncbi:hypothetical protein NDU88_008097 [Pleurodeles waltl]|uniref:Uncharacterized protein n=1 Tax=Pleurodeles waltl TaxID=8319 RepID=A0AAV7N3Z4_PLEWA|nr:hypothetical protein NDU88_008097 [Pleurodeles waltl]
MWHQAEGQDLVPPPYQQHLSPSVWAQSRHPPAPEEHSASRHQRDRNSTAAGFTAPRTAPAGGHQRADPCPRAVNSPQPTTLTRDRSVKGSVICGISHELPWDAACPRVPTASCPEAEGARDDAPGTAPAVGPSSVLSRRVHYAAHDNPLDSAAGLGMVGAQRGRSSEAKGQPL